MRFRKPFLLHIHHIPISLIAGASVVVGCGTNSSTPVRVKNRQSENQIETVEIMPAEDSIGIKEEDAREIGRKHFERAESSGLYLEDRGQHFFVAPPIKSRPHLEKAGILIDKRTGAIEQPTDAPRGTRGTQP